MYSSWSRFTSLSMLRAWVYRGDVQMLINFRFKKKEEKKSNYFIIPGALILNDTFPLSLNRRGLKIIGFAITSAKVALN